MTDNTKGAFRYTYFTDKYQDTYNFYKMQVLRDTEKDLPILFTCWGRIGDEGQYQRTPFGTVAEACTEFGKIFKAKSGNEWSNVKK